MNVEDEKKKTYQKSYLNNERLMNVYNNIARDYSLKRRKPWKALESFLEYLEEKDYKFNGYILDLGCANGRHFELFKKKTNKVIGLDNSIEFLKIASERLKEISQYNKSTSNNIQIVLADIKWLPFRPFKINNLYSIATIHHLKSKNSRKMFMTQILKIMKPDGFILITVWRRWQKRFKRYFMSDWVRRKFNPRFKNNQESVMLKEFGDKLIPWTISSENKSYDRFYHFFSKQEIKKLMKKFKIKEIKKWGGPNSKDNFFILVQK